MTRRSKKVILEYRSDDGRSIRLFCSEMHHDGDEAITVFSLNDKIRQRLLRSRITSVADFYTGEIVTDIDRCLVANSVMSPAEIEKIRQRDKWEWDKKYRLRVIENHYRNKLFALFEFRCFKCSRPGTIRTDYKWMKHVPFWCGLDRDHHVPINLGGHLVPGNIGVLCKSCNSKKHETEPERFYTETELRKLQPYLDKQDEVLRFNFDLEAWQEDRSAYLISLGIDKQLVHQVFNNEDHRYYHPPSSPISISLTIDLGSILQNGEGIGLPKQKED